ncbi:hypothetical protein [Sphingorhabdus sp. YGSMI21]|uniref:hypothetical protein n=1 Tax=Sphingorhabdus sp. YGSMI21 TaxID=2077182 RepID=UPI000C1F1E9F|nr:hypothetical protein [Sphingorhabdus sp. YGSMI21]ATW04499.1 hypothetical protein CHN51_13875 [Sphingorhabdus sp. YGSMI21]
MKKRLFKVGLVAFALCSPSVGYAGVSQDFAGCDGLKKPKKKDDGMRGVAVIEGYSAFGGYNSPAAQRTINSCDRALSSDKLRPTQTMRRAHLLRARAAAKLELGLTEEALADIDEAMLEVADENDSIFFRRSMGVSLRLLRAIAQFSFGQRQEAVALAEEASALRPYALQVQMVSAMIRHRGRPVGEQSASPWADLLKLAPSWGNRLLAQEAEIGNFAAVSEIADSSAIEWPEGPISAFTFLQRQGPGLALTGALLSSLHIAYAHSIDGDTIAARSQLDLIGEKLATLDNGSEENMGIMKILSERIVDPYARLVEARMALSEGRVEDARAKIGSGQIVANAATLEFLQAAEEASQDNAPIEIAGTEGLKDKLEKSRNKGLGGLASVLLIAPESDRVVIDYEKSRPNIIGALVGGIFSMGTSLLGGIDRTAGFRSKDNADGTTTVEYTGVTTSGPLVQEMTLLRAAELAQESQKPRFAIVSRNDYTRFQTMRQHNIEISRTPIGYKSELTIRFLDGEAEAAGTFDTLKIIDDLGPLYYGN